MIQSPMKAVCGPKLRDAAGYSVEFEADVRSFSKEFLGLEKEKLQEVIADVVAFLKQKHPLTNDQEKILTYARKVRNKISHNDLSGAKDELENAGYTVPVSKITEYDISGAKDGAEILAILLNVNASKTSGLSVPNSSDYGKMWDASIKGGCFDLAVDLFTKASNIISTARISLTL